MGEFKMTVEQSVAAESFSLVSFNVLAPCYKRINIPSLELPAPSLPPVSGASDTRPTRIFESECEDLFLPRTQQICETLRQTNADIICLQEFWSGHPAVQAVYEKLLCEQGGYAMRFLERTSHWRSRSDGLAMFVKKDRFLLEDVREILYHDCGDRVALMFVLSLLPRNASLPPQRFICVNTHLLFPHNEYSTKIRLREVTKLLGYLESYKQKELCTTICGRSDVRLPIIVAGDFNGSPRGQVFQYMTSQNFRPALFEACQQGTAGDALCQQVLLVGEEVVQTPAEAVQRPDTSAAVLSTAAQSRRWQTWISHRSHRGTDVAVDHVFFLNPSDQTSDRLPPLPDWTNLVYFEVLQRLLKNYGADNMREVFASFDQDSSNYVTRQEFRAALDRLGFLGEETAALTEEEIDILIASADKNDDGLIDYKEFYDRFWLAAEMMSMDEAHRRDTGAVTNIDSSVNKTLENQEKNMGVMLNTRRFAFARGTWLHRNSSIAQAGSTYPVPLFAPNAVNMGDLKVVKTELYPQELEQGVWPNDYTLSDHGLVRCEFSLVPVASPAMEDALVSQSRERKKDLNWVS